MSENKKIQTLLREKKLKSLECTGNYLNNSKYISCKSRLDQFCEEKCNRIRIRSKFFWDELKIPFIVSLRKSFLKEELSNSQKQAVIRLIEKKDKDKRHIQNWRPLWLLNTDGKILSKALAQLLKETLPFPIPANQSAYVDGRFISESGRLVSNLLEISDTLKLDGLLAAIDIQKAFDSVDHGFIVSTLDRYGFGNRFVRWGKSLLENQESCIINGDNTTKYFKLEKGTRQGDPVSVYLFILVLEILFLCIKENKNTKGLNIFNHTFLYTAYPDDKTFSF